MVQTPELAKIAKVSVPVPIHKPGNVVGHLLTFFEVYSDGGTYKAVPLCSPAHKAVANLPDTICFGIKEGRAVDLNSCYWFIVADIISELRKEGSL